MENVQIVILGAGKGKRMNSSLPKVLIPVNGKSMIERAVGVAVESGLTEKPVVVVSESNKEQIQEKLGDKCFYIVQKEQLGTGHAVLCTMELLKGKYEKIIVLNGDHPFVKEKTLKKLASLVDSKDTMVSMTTVVTDFEGWQKTFFDFGRIIRNANGNVSEIVEKKDAIEDQLQIKEVNVSYYCFNAGWLWQQLANLKNNNNQREYYLTDVVKSTIQNNKKVASCSVNPEEALGINNPEQLFFAENFQKLKNSSIYFESRNGQ